MIPDDDIKADIARAVRSVKSDCQGYCWLYGLLGQFALNVLGIRAQFHLGSTIYRAGPAPMLDCVAYCGRENSGWFVNRGTTEPISEAGQHGSFAGHAWLEHDGDLIDFSVGDWRQHSDHLRAAKMMAGKSTQPINWTVPPLPTFFWTNADALKRPWHVGGTPELGKAWYGPFRGRAGTEDILRAQVALTKSDALDTFRSVLPLVRRNMQILDLPERMRRCDDLSTVHLCPADGAG